MTQKEFARYYKKEMGPSKSYEQAEKDVKGILKALEKAVIEDPESKVVLTGFGVFNSKIRAPRTLQHPKTKELIKVPERISFGFKASPALLLRIRQK